MSKKLIKGITILMCSATVLAGCMSDKIQDQIKEQAPDADYEEEIANSEEIDLDEQIKNNRFDEEKGNFEDNYVMPERQKEMLKEAESQTAEEALKHNQLDEKVVLSKDIPTKKSLYTDGTEAAQYFSFLLFQYHSSQITGESFYESIKSYMHSRFIEILPKSEENRIAMFESLQQLFKEQVRVTITNYEMTEVGYNEMFKEGFFFRKYTLKNGKEIFYRTTIGKGENDEWLIIDDEPSEPYEVLNVSAKFNQKFVESKGE